MARNTKTLHVPAPERNTRAGALAAPARIVKFFERPNLDAPIAWNFRSMDSGGKFRCSLKLLHEFQDRLLRLEGHTIAELLQQAHNHPIAAAKLSAEAKSRLEAMNLDIETLFQLDLGTPARLWGMLEHNIFHVIWLDPEHSVYRS